MDGVYVRVNGCGSEPTRAWDLQHLHVDTAKRTGAEDGNGDPDGPVARHHEAVRRDGSFSAAPAGGGCAGLCAGLVGGASVDWDWVEMDVCAQTRRQATPRRWRYSQPNATVIERARVPKVDEVVALGVGRHAPGLRLDLLPYLRPEPHCAGLAPSRPRSRCHRRPMLLLLVLLLLLVGWVCTIGVVGGWSRDGVVGDGVAARFCIKSSRLRMPD